jgi:enamine deaminase RidA (YjgF/YER057c/UK114 family)
VRPVTDELLLGISGATATVIGLFLVGVFLFIEAGMRRAADSRHEALQPYMRAGTRIVLVLFAVPLLLPFALVAADLSWARVLFVVLSLVLVATNVDSAVRVGASRVTGRRTLLINEVVGTVGVVAIVVLPWLRGGLRPDREDLTLSALIAFATAFVSVGAIALSAFDIAHLDRAGTRPSGAVQRAGGVMFVRGTAGLDPSGVASAPVAEQLAVLWSNVRRLLALNGRTLDDVVRVTSYVHDTASTADCDAARTAALADRAVQTSTVVTTTLPTGWLVDIEVVAEEPRTPGS